jgi:eukaryotic-like serine/threonine-protein kinase
MHAGTVDASMEAPPELPDYEVLSCLGYGARSTIYAVSEKRTGQLYALKRVLRRGPEDDRFLEQAEIEYSISSQFEHPVLRKTHRLIKRRNFLRVSELFLLMDIFDGTSLDIQRPVSMSSLIRIFSQVAQGLSALHKMGYVHADIKPNNILVDDAGKVKIIDFGQSCAIGTVKARIQGTPDYIAPEQVNRRALTPSTDIFNLGATLYWCTTDRHIPTMIPKKKNGVATVDNREAKPPYELNLKVPLPLSRLIMDCVQNRPSDRPADMITVISRLETALVVARSMRKDSREPDEKSSVAAIPDSKDDSRDDKA